MACREDGSSEDTKTGAASNSRHGRRIVLGKVLTCREAKSSGHGKIWSAISISRNPLSVFLQSNPMSHADRTRLFVHRPPIHRPVNPPWNPRRSQPMVITALKRTVPSNMAARNQLATVSQITRIEDALKASLALSRGNVSTMHSILWSSVNLIVSSASAEWPHGHEWTERPRRS